MPRSGGDEGEEDVSLAGNLSTMKITHLLRWLQEDGKTGVLTVEHGKIAKKITFSRGRVVACSSQEPREFLGHYLVSQGKIGEQTLSNALSLQEKDPKPLGRTLVEMGALSPKDLKSHLSSQAEEILISLFEWENAVFCYQDREVRDEEIPFGVDLRVDNVLLKGGKRIVEIRRIRTVFNDPGIVLRRTSKKLPREISENRMASRIYELINGERTVAEILLHAHASEFLVTKFLYELHRSRLVEIEKIRQAPSDAGSAPSAARPSGPIPVLFAPSTSSSTSSAVATAPVSPAVSGTPLDEDLKVASNLMSRGEYDAALDILNDVYKAHQENESLKKLLLEAEASFVESTYRDSLPRSGVPRLLRPLKELEAEHISSQEFFMLSRIDGSWDIKSIIQISPIREVDALRTLKRMQEKGFIGLGQSE